MNADTDTMNTGICLGLNIQTFCFLELFVNCLTEVIPHIGGQVLIVTVCLAILDLTNMTPLKHIIFAQYEVTSSNKLNMNA